jgi:hypothetical protein
MVVLAHIVAVIMDGVALVMVVAGLHVNPLAELKGKKKHDWDSRVETHLVSSPVFCGGDATVVVAGSYRCRRSVLTHNLAMYKCLI